MMSNDVPAFQMLRFTWKSFHLQLDKTQHLTTSPSNLKSYEGHLLIFSDKDEERR